MKLGATLEGSGFVLFDADDPGPAVWAKADDEGTLLVLAQRGKRDRVLRLRP